MGEAGLWPWLTLLGLGAFHGLNPGMGWLFAVALGLHRQSRAVVWGALPPIAIGHFASTLVVAAAVVLLGVFVDHDLIRRLSGLLLIGWGIYHQIYGHRHRARVGMTTGYVGLTLWSFLMATAHGAGLMLIPALIPLCLAGTPAKDLLAEGSMITALLAIITHAAAMLAVTGTIAILVYDHFGLAFLKRGWINVDLLWTGTLILTGLFLLFA